MGAGGYPDRDRPEAADIKLPCTNCGKTFPVRDLDCPCGCEPEEHPEMAYCDSCEKAYMRGRHEGMEEQKLALQVTG